MPSWDYTPWFWHKCGCLCLCSSDHRESLWISSKRLLLLLFGHWLSTKYCWKYSPDGDHALDYLFSADSLNARGRDWKTCDHCLFSGLLRHIGDHWRRRQTAIFTRFTPRVLFPPNTHLYAFWWMGVTLLLEAWRSWDWDWDRDWDGTGCVERRITQDCIPSSLSRGSIYMSGLTALWQWITFCFYAASCCPWCPPWKVRNFFFLVQLRCRMPKAYFSPYQLSQHPCLSEAGRRSGWGSCVPKFFIFWHPWIKTNVSFSKWPSGLFLGITNGIIGFRQPSAVAGFSTQLLCASTKAHPFQW